MNLVAEKKAEETCLRAKLRKRLGKKEYWLGGFGIALSVAIIVAVVVYWDRIRALGSYGYLGAFGISVFGGATVIAPIPMTPVVFALGAVTRPEFAPFLGPIFIGAAAGIGEAIGALIIYMTGYGGGAAIVAKRSAKLMKAYEKILGWMQRRGPLILFILSAVINPFFYPAALGAGALHFDMKRFFFICWGGKTVKGITVALAGYWGLGSIFRAFGIPL
ncbi:MAG: VTT domain-containing protein [Chloroflexi bacterium]|nr:VTT domain-containing protein [Chloroflexota bacterium]